LKKRRDAADVKLPTLLPVSRLGASEIEAILSDLEKEHLLYKRRWIVPRSY